MAAHRVGARWLRLREAIELFVAMGATLGEIPQVIGPEGEYRLRFLVNPENEAFVSLSGYEDDEFVAPSEIASWQRALSIEIPTGDPN